jgi:hypothetical protein
MIRNHSDAHGDNSGVGARANRSFSVGGHLLCRGIVAPGGEFPCPLCYTQFVGRYNRAMALPDDFKIATCFLMPHCHEVGRPLPGHAEQRPTALREISSMAESVVSNHRRGE